MQSVQRKKKPTDERHRFLLLGAAVALLITVAAAAMLIDRSPQPDWPEVVSTAANLYEYRPDEVTSITIRRRGEESWTVIREESGLVLTGEGGFPLTLSTSGALLDAACILPCEAVLTDNPREYADHLADFGLDDPRYEAIVTYSDGVTAHLKIGNPGAENNAWYYMTITGDDRLFTFSRGMVEALFVSRDSLWEVTSPTIHKARIDQITLTGPDGIAAQWSLCGHITDMDASDKWRITAPFVYPADSTAMSTLLGNIANLRLGAYVGPATQENLSACGFVTPRLTIDIRMAAGTIASTNAAGAAEAVDYPASTVTFVIGGARNDMVDYVLHEGNIYVSSHFTMGLFIDYDVRNTMSRYPVMVALGNLASLTIADPQATFEYILTRTERVAENNELLTDAEGNVLYDVTVTCNGEPCDYHAFAAVYNAWTLVTVSGTLPEGEVPAAEPHTVYTFTDVDGTVHTVALATFDVLHDAVIVDGHASFYLIKGGLFSPRPD